MAPSNHGTSVADAACIPGCSAAIWQQRSNADFINAVNSRQETFDGIDYTAIYTRYDEVVTPISDSRGSSSLRPGPGRITNVAIQDICPTATSVHVFLVGTIDPVAYALLRDATAHDGPASPARVPRSVCSELLMPGVNPSTFLQDLTGAATVLGLELVGYPHVPREPALRCHMTGSPRRRSPPPLA